MRAIYLLSGILMVASVACTPKSDDSQTESIHDWCDETNEQRIRLTAPVDLPSLDVTHRHAYRTGEAYDQNVFKTLTITLANYPLTLEENQVTMPSRLGQFAIQFKLKSETYTGDPQFVYQNLTMPAARYDYNVGTSGEPGADIGIATMEGIASVVRDDSVGHIDLNYHDDALVCGQVIMRNGNHSAIEATFNLELDLSHEERDWPGPLVAPPADRTL